MDSLIFVYSPMSFWKVFLLSMLVKMTTVWSAVERQVPFTDVKILTTGSVTSVHLSDIHTGHTIPPAPCYEAFTSRVIHMLCTGTGYASEVDQKYTTRSKIDHKETITDLAEPTVDDLKTNRETERNKEREKEKRQRKREKQRKSSLTLPSSTMAKFAVGFATIAVVVLLTHCCHVTGKYSKVIVV